jgi:hypothetical protein
MNNDELSNMIDQALVSNNGGNIVSDQGLGEDMDLTGKTKGDMGDLNSKEKMDKNRWTAGNNTAPGMMAQGIIGEHGNGMDEGIVASNSSRIEEGVVSNNSAATVCHHTGDAFTSHEQSVVGNNGATIAEDMDIVSHNGGN